MPQEIPHGLVTMSVYMEPVREASKFDLMRVTITWKTYSGTYIPELTDDELLDAFTTVRQLRKEIVNEGRKRQLGWAATWPPEP